MLLFLIIYIYIYVKKVIVFAKSYCPYCKATKATFREILSQLGVESALSYEVIELDLLPENDGRFIQEELYEITGQRTVPNVFVGGVHVGGNSDVQRLVQERRLHDMVRSVSAMSDL